MPVDCKVKKRGDWIKITPQEYIRQLKCDTTPLGIPHCVPSSAVLESTSNGSTDCSIMSGINKKKDTKSTNFLIAGCFLVASSPFGGPVAYYEKASRIITITDSMGHKLSRVSLSDAGEAVYLSWTVEQTNNVLIVLFKRGKVCFYDSRGQEVAGSVDINGSPILYDGSGKGIAIVSSDMYNHKLTVVTVIQDVERGYVASIQAADKSLWDSFGGTPSFTAVAFVSSNEVLLAAKAWASEANQDKVSSLYRVHVRDDGKLRVECSGGRDPFPVDCDVALIAISPSKKRVAALFTNGYIHAGNRNLRTFRLVGKTDTTMIPQQMCWIGNRIISYVFLKAQYGESWVGGSSLFLFQCPILEESDDDEDVEEFSIDARKRRAKASVSGQPAVPKEINNLPDSLIVTKEVDGIKILSSEETQIFQLVPTVVRKAFDFDKMEDPSCCEHAFPSAKLIKAFNDYVSQDSACIDSIGHLVEGADLEDGINDVIEAAGFEQDVAAQKQLLRVASFGKSFSCSFDSQPFVNMTCQLRVMYNLRENGMFLSLQQFHAIKKTIVDRLTRQGLYSLAFKTAELLNLPKSTIVTDWAGKLSRKLATDPSATPVEIAQRIVEKCKACGTKGASLLREITSASVNNVALSMALVSSDPCYGNRVGLKIQLGKHNDALMDANESGDPDLIGQVILSMLAKHSLRCFDQLNRDEGSRALLKYYIVSLRNRQHGHMEENYPTYYANKNPDHAMMMMLEDYFTQIRNNNKRNKKKDDIGGDITDSLIDAVREEGDTRKRLHEHCTLLTKQEVISRIAGYRSSSNNPFLNASVGTTIFLCFKHGLKDEAITLGKQFRVPEKMLCWGKLQGLVAAESWAEVDAMGAGSKSPIGFEPFVQQLVKAERLKQAAKYISKCPGIEKRMELYMLCDDFKGACSDCVKHGEMEMLTQLKERAKTEEAINEVERAIKAFEGKKGGFSLF